MTSLHQLPVLLNVNYYKGTAVAIFPCSYALRIVLNQVSAIKRCPLSFGWRSSAKLLGCLIAYCPFMSASQTLLPASFILRTHSLSPLFTICLQSSLLFLKGVSVETTKNVFSKPGCFIMFSIRSRMSFSAFSGCLFSLMQLFDPALIRTTLGLNLKAFAEFCCVSQMVAPGHPSHCYHNFVRNRWMEENLKVLTLSGKS